MTRSGAMLALAVFRVGFALVHLALAMPTSAQATLDVQVRADRTVGTIQNQFAVTCGPVSSAPGAFDLTAHYRWMRVRSVRIHDCGEVGDIHQVFPDYEADPADVRSYDFAEADRLVLAIVHAGARPLYRLGYSSTPCTRTPVDFDHFATICKHIVLHYTQGWADGFWLKDIEWEVWNEANLRVSWSSGAIGYYRFYETVVRAIREVVPGARVGGPAIAVCWPRDFQEEFIAHCARHQIPLDFFSWHFYGYGFRQSEPYDFARLGRWTRSLLDAHGFTRTANYLTEYNIYCPGPNLLLRRGLAGAAFFASAAIFMQDGHLDLAHHYRGDTCAEDCMGLFVPPTFFPVPRAHAFHALALMQETPVRLEARGGDCSGFAVLAGRSLDGAMHQVLVSDYWSGGRRRKLRVRNLLDRPRWLEVFSVEESGLVRVACRRLPVTRGGRTNVVIRLPDASPWVRLYRLTEVPSETPYLSRLDSRTSVSRPTGQFHLTALEHAGRDYVVLAGTSGVEPGVLLSPGVTLPLNLDTFTFWVLSNLNRPGYLSLAGTLDARGEAAMAWELDALSSGVRGRQLWFAAVLYGGGRPPAVTNAVNMVLD